MNNSRARLHGAVDAPQFRHEASRTLDGFDPRTLVLRDSFEQIDDLFLL